MNEYVDKVINLAFRVVPLSNAEVKYTADGYSDENKAELIRVATKKKVLPVVGKLLSDIGVDKDCWVKYYNRFLDRNRKVIALFDEIFTAFWKSNISRVCIYENFGALLASGNDLGLYSSGDVDLLADVAEKEKIKFVLAYFGYYPTASKQDSRNVVTEFLKTNGIIRINVAWKPLLRFALPIKIDTERCIGWDRLVRYKDTAILLPSPDTLLYLCFIRIAVHGYSRSPDVRLYIDAHNATCTKPDWNIALRWAKDDCVLTKFLAVAYIANRLNGVEVPENVLRMAQQDAYAQKIIEIAYDEERRALIYDPARLKLLKLEAASDRKTVFAEVFTMVFPPVSWLKDFYATPGNGKIKIYFNYYMRFIGK